MLKWLKKKNAPATSMETAQKSSDVRVEDPAVAENLGGESNFSPVPASRTDEMLKVPEKKRKVPPEEVMPVMIEASDERDSVMDLVLGEEENVREEEERSEHPDCWSWEQYENKCKEYPWLTSSKGKLGCKICREVKNLGTETSQGVHFSLEWVNSSVSSYGPTKEKQHSALRKKMYLHKSSACHLKAVAILDVRTCESITQLNSRMQVKLYEDTCRVFRSAYKIGKHERPFTDLPLDVDVQRMNGVDLGRVLHSDHSCADIIEHIATTMRAKLVHHILQNESKISVLIDESTTFSKLTTLIICIRACIEKEDPPLTFFLDLVELPGTSAEIIFDKLLACLQSYGLTDDYLRMHLIQLVTDGASNMIGRKSGVGTLLKIKYPQLTIWHCANHKLELAVGDVSKEVTGINQLKIFFDKLYATYHASPKNQRELGECAAQVEVRLLKIGKILDIRWVASSERSVKAVWNNYKALNKHFGESSCDTARSETERNKYCGLNRMLTSTVFVENLGIMFDALTELGDLSRQLQRRDMTLYEADRIIQTHIYVFESMALSPGPYATATATAVEQMQFNGIQLQHSNTKGCISISRAQFFRSLTNNICQRMTTATASNLSKNTSNREGEIEYKQLIDAMKLLNPHYWPVPVDIQYGDADLQAFCDKLHVFDARQYINAFRDYKQNKDCMIPIQLKPLARIVETFSTSTADCERGFSVMNDVLTPLRNRMSVTRLSSVMFLKIVGPPVTEFIPDCYVRKWLQKGRRSADASNCMARRQVVNESAYKQIWNVLASE
ncbi:E3 SUMO-protein ligase KIAA1586-like [Ambystoma mexicanum]|uniref:E3 SUMO-protein ligase KIAA1586-like n=1 Tax=Ambystoma mexicanum TaxID=8296 RepID=UPI0037E7052A